MHNIRDISLRSASPSDTEFVFNLMEATMRNHVIAVWGFWNAARVMMSQA